ncbi:hypothetical protein ACFGZQ_06000 [Pasteurella multocida]
MLLAPTTHELDSCIEKNLEYCGYDVINFSYSTERTCYPSIKEKLFSKYIKLILKDKKRLQEYRDSFIHKKYEIEIDEILTSSGEYIADYFLCIRPDIYPKELIEKLKRRALKSVAYQWDGMERYPKIFEYISYFDKFFCFNVDEAKKFNLEFITNFYFDYLLYQKVPVSKNRCYFIGWHIENRSESIKIFLEEASKLNLTCDFYLAGKVKEVKKFFKYSNAINYIGDSISLGFEENLRKVQESEFLIDFLNDTHVGLSFRVFEALHFGKKLITTNYSIVDYDFYHPNNIFVWDGKDISGLKSFLQLPYFPLEQEIILKYSFSHWVKRIIE